MKTSRRTFLKSGAMVALGAAILPRSAFASSAQEVMVGLQLYSVRDDMKSDPKGSLKKLADMGYKVVEHAGYANRKFYGFDPSEFKKILEDLGLKMYSGHVDFGMQAWDASKNDFTDTWKHTVEDAAYMGQKFVKVVEHAGYANRKVYGFDPSEFKKILEDLGLKMYSGHVDFGMQAWDASRNRHDRCT